jgi:hypothetical protein
VESQRIARKRVSAVPAFTVEELHKKICEISIGQVLGSHIADEGIDLGCRALVFLGKGGLDRLCAGVGNNLGYAFRLCELLCQLHDEASDGDAARGP